MTTETKFRNVMAGEVLTKGLLKRIDKAAYQFGGLKTTGESSVKIIDGKPVTTRPTAYIQRSHVRGNVELFLQDFAKTMNANVYHLQLI